MKREIKFRVWDKHRKAFQNESLNDLLFYSNEDLHFPDGFEPPQQFSGLKDKNGKEIYEGDIVKFGGEAIVVRSRDVGEVYFEDGRFRVRAGDSIRDLCNYFNMHCTIIGNIYENSELLR